MALGNYSGNSTCKSGSTVTFTKSNAQISKRDVAQQANYYEKSTKRRTKTKEFFIFCQKYYIKMIYISFSWI